MSTSYIVQLLPVVKLYFLFKVGLYLYCWDPNSKGIHILRYNVLILWCCRPVCFLIHYLYIMVLVQT